MMGLPKFKYLAPQDIKEACAALKEFSGQAAIWAGGTELMMDLKRGLKTPAYLLSLKKLSRLTSLHNDSASGFILGAMLSLRNLAGNAQVKSELAALAQAAENVASPQIRGMATIGGNVCLDTRCWYYNRSKRWRASFPSCYKAGGNQCYVIEGGKQCYALFQADTVPSLLVMKAKLKLVNCSGERIIPIEEFYSGRGKVPNRLSAEEILTEINIPNLPPPSGTAYFKYSKRGAVDFPILGLASLLRLNSERKRCEEARFAITGHGSTPLLIEATELLKGLDGPNLTEDLTNRLLEGIKPVPHMGISASLKRRIARVLLQRALRDTWKVAQECSHDR
jgi:4-hydroxybenzoyl-CoA reductase subunit beta